MAILKVDQHYHSRTTLGDDHDEGAGSLLASAVPGVRNA